jgi:hypothetical protein
MGTRALLLFCVFTLGACGREAPRSADATRTDSAGVEIVTHSAATVSTLPEWRLADTPRYRIGEVEGASEYQFFRVSGVSVLPGDTVVVVNGGSQEVRFYDGRGRFIQSVGRKGDGPGEFQFPSGIWRIGDSLEVWDGALRRVSVFADDGRFVRVAPLERKGLNTEIVGVFADGSFVTRDMWMSIKGEAMSPVLFHLAAFGADGQFRDSLPDQPDGLMGVLGESGLVGGPLFGVRAAMSADARSYWVGTGERPEIRRFGADGKLRQVVRWPDEDRTVSQDDVDRYWAKVLEGIDRPDRQAQMERVKRSMPVADAFPVFDGLQSTRGGGVWIKLYRHPEDEGPDRWMVADSSGALVARIVTPQKLRIFEIGADYVAGTQPDDMDVEHVVVYGLEKSGTGGR